MSMKHCDCHDDCDRQRLYRWCCVAFVVIILHVLLIVLVVWLVLRPNKPHFVLNDLAIDCFNVTAGGASSYSYSSSFLTVIMQATLAAYNPNDRVGIFYDHAVAYAEYEGLQITVPTLLPVIYQGHLDTSIWSPFLSGNNVPLLPNLAESITQDLTAGYLLVTVCVDGWIRWKAGAFITSHYHLRVRCPALLTVNGGRGSYGSNSAGGNGYFTFQHPAPCVVDV